MTNVSASPASKEGQRHRHAVQFYESTKYLCAAVSAYFADGFKHGKPMVVIAGPENREAFLEHLKAAGTDVEAAIAEGRFRQLDAQETLAQFMESGLPNPQRFKAVIGGVLEECGKCGAGAALTYGEMVDILWREGKCEAAVRVEELWNELAHSHPFDLLCAYGLKGFNETEHNSHFEQICATHSEVTPTEQYLHLEDKERQLHISVLQRKALVLETEIERRREAEKALLHALDEQRLTHEDLLKTERELRGLLENAAEGLHWVGLDGTILWANKTELEVLGYSADEYIGHKIDEFHTDQTVVEDILRRLNSGESLRNYGADLRARDSSIRHVLINSNLVRTENGPTHTQCFTRDITELKAAMLAQAFLSAVVESGQDAIISKTLDGVITSWNPGAQRLLGYTAEEVIGKSITILIPESQHDEEPAILERLRRGERIEHYETKRRRKDGTLVDISLTVSPVKDARGRIIGASKIARDITDRKRFDSERNELLKKERVARSEAEAANRVKDEFLAMVSHELRTPLNAILGWTAILETRKEEELITRAVEVIKRNAGLQKRMIEDLLDVARVLTGKMAIKAEPVELRSVLGDALDSVSTAAVAKEIRVEQEFPETIPPITGDAERLQQVFWNILSNSIKFTPPKGLIRLHLRRTAAGVEITFKDFGEGIPPTLLPRVFDRFTQADTSLSRHGGLGIGLAIVRYLVEAHGGTVFAESEGKGKGATFTVRLPLGMESE